MLLKSRANPFNSEEYLFEIKWDGYRCIIFINNKEIYIQSRNGKNITQYFPELTGISDQFNAKHAVIDGEICYFDKRGKPVFSKLQGRLSSGNKNIKYPVTFIAWDLLSFDRKEIYNLPLIRRKNLLSENINENNRILLSKYIKRKGKTLYKQAKKEDMEGIVAKKIDSPYEFKRSEYWLKIKIWKYTDTIIGGYLQDKTGLVVGKKFESNSKSPHINLQYMGKVKLALPSNMKTALFKFIPTIAVEQNPFIEKPDIKGVTWIKPTIKCQVRYTKITKHNSFRHGYAVKILL